MCQKRLQFAAGAGCQGNLFSGVGDAVNSSCAACRKFRGSEIAAPASVERPCAGAHLAGRAVERIAHHGMSEEAMWTRI